MSPHLNWNFLLQLKSKTEDITYWFQPYLVISVVCVWCTHHKVQGILYLDFNAIGPCIKSSTVRWILPFEKQKNNELSLSCLFGSFRYRLQGPRTSILQFTLLIVTLFISYIRGKSSPQIEISDTCMGIAYTILCVYSIPNTLKFIDTVNWGKYNNNNNIKKDTALLLRAGTFARKVAESCK